MSDETVNYEGNNPTGAAQEPAQEAPRPAAFCQDCGRPLTQDTMRPVGQSVFCEPCLTARVAAGPQHAPPLARNGMGHPLLAALLGFIPGVGAMYNGQFAKGIAHLVVFAVLASLSDHAHGIFGLFMFGWIVYQVFDAFYTAQARRDGTPLPNPFGFNDIGERMGFGKGWGTVPTAQGRSGAVPPAGPVGPGPDWVGYVPPTNFGSTPYAAAPPVSPAWTEAGTTAEPAQNFTRYATPEYAPVAATTVPPVAMPPVRRFPAGAIWLIGLGLVFLLAEFAPEWGWSWEISQSWIMALIFAGLAAWTFARRMHLGVAMVSLLRWPVVLATLSLLSVLQAVGVASFSRTWPVLFIVLGVMLILERTAWGSARYTGPYAAVEADDVTKGGQ